MILDFDEVVQGQLDFFLHLVEWKNLSNRLKIVPKHEKRYKLKF